MADSPRKRYSPSPSPWEEKSRSRSRSRSRSYSRQRGRSRSRDRNDANNPGDTLYVTGLSTRVTERDLEEHFSKEGKSRRKRARTPTPGHYLGLKTSRGESYRGDRGRYRGYNDYGHRRSPRRSPYRGGRERDYSPRRSPYGGRSRRDRSRSYSPYRSLERNYGRGR